METKDEVVTILQQHPVGERQHPADREPLEQEPSRERNVRILGEVMQQVSDSYAANPNAKFVAMPGALGMVQGQIDCEVVTLQVFLPHTPAGCDVADQIIRKATGQEPPARIVHASKVGRG